MNKLCILTPHPLYPENWQHDAGHYQELLGGEVVFRPWTDADDISEFSAVMPLLAWGYPADTRAWFAALDRWEAAGVKMANPVATLRWNSNKNYLIELANQGVAIVPTTVTAALDHDDLIAARLRFGSDDLVIKPSISGGAKGTYRLGINDPIPLDVSECEMLIQPLMPAIADEGEYSLFYFASVFSHAIRKIPAQGDFRVQEQFGGQVTAVDAPAQAQQLAMAALRAAPVPPLYARVDMVRAGTGDFALMELELIEPSLFLPWATDGGAALASAVRLWLSAPVPHIP